MLFGDRTKCATLVLGVAFATVLMAQQSAFCVGLIGLAGNAVRDIPEVDVWVMRPGTRAIDNALALPATDLYRVRSVPGVAWAVPLFRGTATVRISDGSSQAVSIVGLDDTSLVGVPQSMLVGRIEDLRRPSAVILNRQGHDNLFPGAPNSSGGTLELNERRAVIVGVADAMPQFGGSNIAYTRYSNATRFVAGGRNVLTFVLVRAAPGFSGKQVAAAVGASTGLLALTRADFVDANIRYVVETSGIVFGFGLIVALGAIVGLVIVALTLSLFVQDHLRYFGALKAIGARDGVLVAMVLVQALASGAAGFGIGIGATAWLLEFAADAVPDFATFHMPWQVMAGTGLASLATMLAASVSAVRRVRRVDPALVFRG